MNDGDKVLLVCGAGIALDTILTGGKITRGLLKFLTDRKKVIVVTEKDLINMGFGC